MKEFEFLKLAKLLILGLLSQSGSLYGFSFNEAMQAIEGHPKVKVLHSRHEALSQKAISDGSWGDPRLKIAAKNLPKDSLGRSETPMSGIELSLSQKIALSNKFGDLRRAGVNSSDSILWNSRSAVEGLRKELWNLLIEVQKTYEQKAILRENYQWIENMISVSEKLYSTGKINQEALLELKIRKSELRSSLTVKEFQIQSFQEDIKYLLGEGKVIEMPTVPWSFLTESNKALDSKERSLQSRLKAKEFALSAAKKELIPDLTLSVGYTSRSYDDQLGDLVTVAATIPIPSSGKRYANKKVALEERKQLELGLRDYRRQKESKIGKLKILKEKVKAELEILESTTIKFAENARKVVSKSYQLGSATYSELLQTEFKLQNLKLNRTQKMAELRSVYVETKYIRGEKLYE